MNKYKPKIICEECGKTTWNYEDNTLKAKCKSCGKLNTKEELGLLGATISKNEQGHYTLSFTEYKFVSIFPRWIDLVEEIERLNVIDKRLERVEIYVPTEKDFGVKRR